jgi:hypothetical protein
MKIATVVTLTILLAAAESPGANAQSDQKDAASLKASWRSTMSQTDTPDVGCYTAARRQTARRPPAMAQIIWPARQAAVRLDRPQAVSRRKVA